MNDTETSVIKCLCERRSVRSFRPEPLTDGELSAILRAGTFAPTGRNFQSPVIIVVRDKETISELSALNAEILGSVSDPFYGAPILLVVLADGTNRTCTEDGSLVIGNMLNAAYSLGIGGCWIHRAREMFKTDAGLKYLKKWGLPETYVGIGNCILGYPSEGFPPARPRKEGYIIFDS